MTKKQIEINDVSEIERRSAIRTDVMLVRNEEEESKTETHIEYCFIPVDNLPPTDSWRSILNQLSAAFNSGFVALKVIEAGPDKRLSIRISYEVDGPDPEEESEDAIPTD